MNLAGMSNVLSDKKKQGLALGRPRLPRRLEALTGVRRETASRCLKAAGVAVRGRGRRPREARPATSVEVSTDPESEPAIEVSTDSGAKAASLPGVSTDPEALPGRSPGASRFGR